MQDKAGGGNTVLQNTGQSTTSVMSQKAVTDAIAELSKNGANYLMVYGVGTPTENAAELQAVYNAAKNMPRYIGDIDSSSQTLITVYKGQTFHDVGAGVYGICVVDFIDSPSENIQYSDITEIQAKSTKITVIVAPGEYKFNINNSFTVDTNCVDIVSLTGNRDIKINGLKVSTANVLLKGFDAGEQKIQIINALDLTTVFDNCIGGVESFSVMDDNLGGTFINCECTASGFNAFNSFINEAARFINCKSVYNSFGYNALAVYGYFENCEAGDNSFASYLNSGLGLVHATFKNCKGGNYCFGSSAKIGANAIFDNCHTGDYGFGSCDGEYSSELLGGSFSHCSCKEAGFGVNAISNYGRFFYCKSNYGDISSQMAVGDRVIFCIENDAEMVNINY
ncbi:MAG: hypothetical protein QM800_12680 [Paludibacter sp.]